MKTLTRIPFRILACLAIALAILGPVAPVLAATLTGNVTVQTNVQYTGTVGLSTVSSPLSRSVVTTLTSGTGSGQANMVYTAQVSLGTSSSTSLDLAGSLTDAFGTVITFTTVKAIIIESAGANTVDLTVGNGTNPFVGPFGAAAHTIAVRPGGVLLDIAPQTGWSVTAATADILKIANGAAAVVFNITIIGTV